ncbi:MAG: 3-hydroxyacyl-CoA dehydrogenase NAD-binding domain-containing protein [Opitutaceae bacterium]|nr:3-hydroxyacyl-CoA dehydrogenase NAD-binding domain-containing protein [Opitutaceae bacterium]
MTAASQIRRELDASGIATLTFDRAGSSANVFDRATLEELDTHLAFLTAASGLKGVVLASAKPAIFIAGADLHAFSPAPAESVLTALVALGQNVFARLAALPVPTVAAIHGACLGGGCELALACDWRVASNAKATRIGLAETQLGILPAWGGCTRLPALIGLPAALKLILGGKPVVGLQALKLGLVDDVAPPEYLLAAARTLLARGRRPAAARRLAHLRPLPALIARKSRTMVLARTRGHYPAPLRAIDVCVQALGRPVETGLALERTALLELSRTPACRNLLGLFMLQERAKKISRPELAGLTSAPVRRVAVIGAGVMGSGIAQWLAARGLSVLLQDIDAKALAGGLHRIETLVRGGARRRLFTPAEAAATLDRVTPILPDAPLTDCDLVIEAAVERLDLKQKIFRDLESRTRPETVLATNTSALSIDALAGELANPERVVGLHFFNPVHRMKLIEVVRGARTSPAALAAALEFAKAIGKLPVIARDQPGFLVNRVLMPAMGEAVRLFNEGHAAETIDRHLLAFGMPMGPLRLADEVGLDVALHVQKDLAARLPNFVQPDGTLEKMTAKGWLGRKSGCGFYLHGPGRRAKTNPAAAEFQSGRASAMDGAAMTDRVILPMINEAARCLDQKVIEAPEDVDFAMVLGTGWAPFRGGPLRHADAVGVPEVVRRLESLARDVAPHFGPCEHLRHMAAQGRTFYPAPP